VAEWFKAPVLKFAKSRPALYGLLPKRPFQLAKWPFVALACLGLCWLVLSSWVANPVATAWLIAKVVLAAIAVVYALTALTTWERNRWLDKVEREREADYRWPEK
jgi:hypothetical protein